MSDTETKTFSIRGVTVANIEKFNTDKEKSGFSPAGYFDKLLNGGNSNVDGVNTDGLQQTVNELTEVNTALQDVNNRLETQNTGLHNRLAAAVTLAGNYQDFRRASDASEFACIENFIEELQKKADAQPSEIEKKLIGTQFVFEPKIDQAKLMNRAIALDRKEGNLNGIEQSVYLQNFAERAIKYYLKNEYSHI